MHQHISSLVERMLQLVAREIEEIASESGRGLAWRPLTLRRLPTAALDTMPCPAGVEQVADRFHLLTEIRTDDRRKSTSNDEDQAGFLRVALSMCLRTPRSPLLSPGWELKSRQDQMVTSLQLSDAVRPSETDAGTWRGEWTFDVVFQRTATHPVTLVVARQASGIGPGAPNAETSEVGPLSVFTEELAAEAGRMRRDDPILADALRQLRTALLDIMHDIRAERPQPPSDLRTWLDARLGKAPSESRGRLERAKELLDRLEQIRKESSGL